MKLKRLSFFVCALMVATIMLGLFACGKRDEIVFSVDGKDVPSTMTAELGNLFIMPQVEAKYNGQELDVEVKVLDSKETEVDLINKKFKVTDADGYKLKFSATAEGLSGAVEIKVNTSDTKAPSFSINGISGLTTPKGGVVTVPECTVNDASSNSLTATFSVKDPNEDEVTVIDNKFTVDIVGDYVITYFATDSSGNNDSKDFIVVCKNAVILNDFENVNDLGWMAFDVDNKEVVSENTRHQNALKVSISETQSSTNNWRGIYAPFRKAGGGFWSWEELLEFEAIQFNVYTPVANQMGHMLSVVPIEMGWNTIYYTMEELATVYEADSNQYQENENGFYINLKTVNPGSYLIFDYMIGIYADDYKPAVSVSLGDGTPLPKQFNVNSGRDFTIPPITAIRENKAMVVDMSAEDSSGNAVNITDDSFTATDLNGYTIVYTCTDSYGPYIVRVPLVVKDTSIPSIVINGMNNIAVVGSAYKIPTSTVITETNETLNATATVNGPSGAVAIAEGKFVPDKVGDYTITYTATSAVNGKTGRSEFVVNVKKGSILNSFDIVSDVGFVAYANEKTLFSENNIYGIKLNNIAESATNWARICIPLSESDGTFVKWDDLKDFTRIDFYLYASSNMDIGLVNGTKSVKKGQSVLSFTKAEILTAYEVDSSQYEENENGFYLNVKTANPGEYIIFQAVIAEYPENYIPAVIFTQGESVPAASAEIGKKEFFTIPEIKARRKKLAEEMIVTFEVKDSKGNVVSISENKFQAMDLEGYTIVYTAMDTLGREEFIMTIAVVDNEVPNIVVDSANSVVAYWNDLITVPSSTIVYEVEELVATVTVKDPNGASVTLSNGKFETNIKGSYQIIYTAVATNGKTAEKIITVNCVYGKCLNDFSTVEDVTWTNNPAIKDKVSDGVRLTWSVLETAHWGTICVPFQKTDGAYYTWQEIEQFERIEIVFYLSSANEIGLPTSVSPMTAGKNTLTYTLAELQAEQVKTGELYTEDANGYRINIKNVVADDYIIFGSIVGYYAENA